MKYIVVWEEDDHQCEIKDIVTEDKFDEYIEYRKQELLKVPSRITGKTPVFHHYENSGGRVWYAERLTPEEYYEWVTKMKWQKPIQTQDWVGLGSFDYQVIDGLNNFEKC